MPDDVMDIDEETKARAKARLEGLSVSEVSAVDRAANKRTFLVMKNDTTQADDAPAEETDMPDDAPVAETITKSDKMERAHDILWGAMDKLKDRLYPENAAAQEAVLQAVVSAVSGDDGVMMSADVDADALAKAADAVSEALVAALDGEAVAIVKAAIAAGPRPAAEPEPAPEPEPVNKTDSDEPVGDADGADETEPEPDPVDKAGKAQLSNARARKFRDAMSAMVKLLHEMDPTLEKEALWPQSAKKSDEPEADPEPTDVEKRASELEAENSRLKAEVAELRKRAAPSAVIRDEEPPRVTQTNRPALNLMDLNAGLDR